jgi:hypothetical protein
MIRRLLWVAAFVVLIQFVPYGHHHTNPPVTKEPAWDSPQTRELAKRACFDCHSNETTWPWYSNVAPVSWLVQDDVDGGRHHLNFSEWDKPQRHAHDAAEEIENGDMPIWFYVPLHPAAKLSAEEKSALIAGLKKMPGFQKDKD